MSRTIPALPVHQWLPTWDEVKFDSVHKRRKPEPKFYMFSISARDFVRLANVYQRRAEGPRAQEEAIQRKSASERVDEISKFIQGGYPWSDISDRQKSQPQFQDLRMPGWLPTAVVANILPPGAERQGNTLEEVDTVIIEDRDGHSFVRLPSGFDDANWSPSVKPIEVIDGQHRLLAFQAENIDPSFEIPVVAFVNLDVTWQAYLFYTINIKPKKINTSLAFDLYPLLRIQDWLDKSSSAPSIYRETRAQEITEILWSHPESPWKGKISMLGDQSNLVSQAAFIRALINTYIRKWDSSSIGGLFGAEIDGPKREILAWNRSQQSAFLIELWRLFQINISITTEGWAQHLRRVDTSINLFDKDQDVAFWGSHSLIASDQGIRGFFQVTNDIFYTLSQRLELSKWVAAQLTEAEVIDSSSVSEALHELGQQRFYSAMQSVTSELTKFDWRSPATADLTEDEIVRQSGFKGSSGYKEMRRRLISLLAQSSDADISWAAKEVQRKIK